MRALLILAFLASCNQWMRSSPSEYHVRSLDEQRAAAVYVTASCYPFLDPGIEPGPTDIGHAHQGWGVLVSDWQVLTALHVVDCQSTIAVIHIWRDGKSYRFAPEREWRGVDVARVQIVSADSVPGVTSPVVRYSDLVEDELLYVHGRETLLGESLGGALYRVPTEKGYSGAGVYDMGGKLVGVHLGHRGDLQQFARIQEDMLP